ncbi:MAG: hypothetical protein L6Q92_15885 [Phycisphaerae bacterium]|nr:hypothetical protein [Phycisphaerae bacterium]
MAESNNNNGAKYLAAGTRVRVVTPTPIPEWSEWDDDGGRISGPVKKRLQQMFFNGDRRVQAEVVHIPSETERDGLRRKGRCKVRVKEASGSTITFTADATNLQKA